MSYIDKMLHPGEQVVYRTRLHWSIFFKPLVGVMFAIALGTFEDVRLGVAAGLFLVFFVLPYSISVLTGFIFSEVVITNRRFIARLGLRRINFTETVLDKVDAVQVEQGTLGRVLRYGTLVVNTAGGASRSIGNVPKPDQVKETLQRQITANI